MDYQEAIRYISDLQEKKGSCYSLEAVQRLCEMAGRPERSLSVVHIAGTNGKGSVGTYLGNMLAQSGYTVGRFVSPAVFDYREQVQKIVYDGTGLVTEYISESETAEILSMLRKLVEEMEMSGEETPTAFEIETVMAFVAMKYWQVDVALIECGMGGENDATNIIESPLLCLFTGIGLDHTLYLGNTIPEIAREKSGILKQGAIALSAKQDSEAEEILRKRCEELGIPFVMTEAEEVSERQYCMGHTSFRYQGMRYEMRQSGTCQIDNAVLALKAAEVLQGRGYGKLTDHSMQEALWQSRWPGRFECLLEKPYVFVDGAHNPPAARELRKSLEAYFPGERFTYIYGIFQDKDYVQVTEILLPLAKRVYTLSTAGERGLSAEVLAQTVQRENDRWASASMQQVGNGSLEAKPAHCLDTVPVRACASVAEALQLAVQKPERILVFGSLSFLREVYACLESLR